MNDWMDAKEVAITIGNQQITGNNCIVKSLNVTEHVDEFEEVATRMGDTVKFKVAPEPVEITIELMCNPDDLSNIFMDETPKIRNKKVDDCTVRELLYAVRQKINGGKLK